MKLILGLAPLLYLFLIPMPSTTGPEPPTMPWSDGAPIVLTDTAPRGFPEADATIRDLLISFDEQIGYEVFPLYRDLFTHLPSDVRIWVAVAEKRYETTAREFLLATGMHPGRIAGILDAGPVSVWARDRVLALSNEVETIFEVPEDGFVVGDRLEDRLIAHELGRRVPGTSSREVAVSFEGGNVLYSRDHVFLGANLVADNPAWIDYTDQQLDEALHAFFGCSPVLIGSEAGLPHEHLDMYLTVIGERDLLLGDPTIGATFLRRIDGLGMGESPLPPCDLWTLDTQERFAPAYEAIRADLIDRGFRVHRIPVLHGEDGGILTWNNALVERRGATKRAIIPSYGVPWLDETAKTTYERLGLDCRTVDCSRIIHRGGAIRCVTNVLRWQWKAREGH
ncbi:MAG: hypothetical protein H6834_08855 [Planctomycetes bacterium]|nr:hypothetical protein [Planctomycetota bacterium]